MINRTFKGLSGLDSLFVKNNGLESEYAGTDCVTHGMLNITERKDDGNLKNLLGRIYLPSTNINVKEVESLFRSPENVMRHSADDHKYHTSI